MLCALCTTWCYWIWLPITFFRRLLKRSFLFACASEKFSWISLELRLVFQKVTCSVTRFKIVWLFMPRLKVQNRKMAPESVFSSLDENCHAFDFALCDLCILFASPSFSERSCLDASFYTWHFFKWYVKLLLQMPQNNCKSHWVDFLLRHWVNIRTFQT